MPTRSRGISMRELVPALLLAAMAVPVQAADAQPASLRAITIEPRAFGYHVGDRVEREVVVHAPAGYVLDASSLPRPGARGKPVELQGVSHDIASDAGGTRHALRLRYQVFLSPPEVRTIEMAPFTLTFQAEGRDQRVRVDAWPLTVAPLVPVDVSPREGLGELRPDMDPPLFDTRPSWQRLLAYGAVILLCLAYLAQVYLVVPWWSRRQRPFAQAWRRVGPLGTDASPADWRQAFQHVHDALNLTAGEVMFEQGVDRFVAAQPRYAGLRADLLAFFQRSRREFFAEGRAGAQKAGAEGAWLVDFCRKCRDAERGAA